MQRFLIDTHIIIWWVDETQSHLINRATRDILSNSENALFLSSISLWEIHQKISTGRMSLDIMKLETLISDNEITYLSFNEEHGKYASKLPWHHKDPFDRMLIAQSICEDIPFITGDRHIHQYEEAQIIKA